MFVCLSTYLSVCLSIYLSTDLSICLAVYLSVFLSICLSVYLSSIIIYVVHGVYKKKHKGVYTNAHLFHIGIYVCILGPRRLDECFLQQRFSRCLSVVNGPKGHNSNHWLFSCRLRTEAVGSWLSRLLSGILFSFFWLLGSCYLVPAISRAFRTRIVLAMWCLSHVPNNPDRYRRILHPDSKTKTQYKRASRNHVF